MITTAEKLAALNVEISVQLLANDVAILLLFGEFAKIQAAEMSNEYVNLTYGPILEKIVSELKANAEFMNQVNDKLNR